MNDFIDIHKSPDLLQPVPSKEETLAGEAYGWVKPVAYVAGTAVAVGAGIYLLERGIGLTSILKSKGLNFSRGVFSEAGGMVLKEAEGGAANLGQAKSTLEILQSRGLIAKLSPVLEANTIKPSPKTTLEIVEELRLAKAAALPKLDLVNEANIASSATTGARAEISTVGESLAAETTAFVPKKDGLVDALGRAEKLRNVEVPESLQAATTGVSFGRPDGLAAPIFATEKAASEAAADYAIIINRQMEGGTTSWMSVQPTFGVTKFQDGFIPVIDIGVDKGLLMLDDAGKAAAIRTQNGLLVELGKLAGSTIRLSH